MDRRRVVGQTPRRRMSDLATRMVPTWRRRMAVRKEDRRMPGLIMTMDSTPRMRS